LFVCLLINVSREGESSSVRDVAVILDLGDGWHNKNVKLHIFLTLLSLLPFSLSHSTCLLVCFPYHPLSLSRSLSHFNCNSHSFIFYLSINLFSISISIFLPIYFSLPLLCFSFCLLVCFPSLPHFLSILILSLCLYRLFLPFFYPILFLSFYLLIIFLALSLCLRVRCSLPRPLSYHILTLYLSINLSLSPWVHFINIFTRSFYAHSSPKHKNSVKSSVSFFNFGIYACKSCS